VRNKCSKAILAATAALLLLTQGASAQQAEPAQDAQRSRSTDTAVPNAKPGQADRERQPEIRLRSMDSKPAGSSIPPAEKAPSIDADAQKALVDRMKGCCGDAPKN
jgi:hypothetical protein